MIFIKYIILVDYFTNEMCMGLICLCVLFLCFDYVFA